MIQTITTSSPDRRRYKEFFKRGGVLRYMPCWNLDELQTVGAYVAARCDESLKDFYAPEAIEERYDRFGVSETLQSCECLGSGGLANSLRTEFLFSGSDVVPVVV